MYPGIKKKGHKFINQILFCKVPSFSILGVPLFLLNVVRISCFGGGWLSNPNWTSTEALNWAWVSYMVPQWNGNNQTSQYDHLTCTLHGTQKTQMCALYCTVNQSYCIAHQTMELELVHHNSTNWFIISGPLLFITMRLLYKVGKLGHISEL